MITFKFNDFCFTVNASTISHIIWGSASILQLEKEETLKIYKAYKDSVNDCNFNDIPGSRLHLMQNKGIGYSNSKTATDDLKFSYLDSLSKHTLISIRTQGDCINLSAKLLLHVSNKLKGFEEDFEKYIAVSDFIDFMCSKFSTNAMSYICIDFNSDECLKEFYEFIKESVNTRKKYITKMISLKKVTTVKITDYLIYFNSCNGNYVVSTESSLSDSWIDSLTF